MTNRLGNIVDRLMSAGMQQKALSAGMGAALGAVLGPTAATLTGDDKSDKNTLTRDMIAGALGGAIGGLAGAAPAAIGGVFSGAIAGMFDREKKSSVPGQDLRTPMAGGTKFPTSDSTQMASKKLQQSSAEVGPQPATLYSAMGKMKAGDTMDPMNDDPLVLYLEKNAAKDSAKTQPPLTDLIDGSVLKDNLDSMPLGKEEHEMASMPPGPTSRMESKADVRPEMSGMFENSHTTRRKYEDKDHSFEGFDKGVVDRILGL